MNPSAYLASEQFHFFNSLLDGFDAGAVIDNENKILAIKSETAADLGSIPHAAHTTTKYFKLQPGDAVLLNDPYSGGNISSQLTLIAGLPFELILVVRFGLTPDLSLSANCDQEGLRIPPSPLMQNFQITEPMLEALGQHPQCSKNFIPRLRDAIKDIVNLVKYISTEKNSLQDLLSIAALKTYHQNLKSEAMAALQETPHGDGRGDFQLDSGESLKYRLTVDDHGLNVDFGGTSTSSSKLHMTEEMTLGAVLTAWLTQMNASRPINPYWLSLVHIQTPRGSWLQAKHPAPILRGFFEGVPWVAGCMIQTLSQIASKNTLADMPFGPLALQLKFDERLSFFDNLATGGPAVAEASGEDGAWLWQYRKAKGSVQQIERLYPIQISKISWRRGSGGSSTTSGGDGIVKEYKLLKPAKLTWTSYMQTKPTSPKSVWGLTNEIRIQKKDGKIETLKDPRGSVDVEAGDIVTVLTAGGSGLHRVAAPQSL